MITDGQPKGESDRGPWIAAAAGLVVGACILALDLRVVISQLMVDDSFYYLEIARNVATGRGATFDGIHPTNGFHPLYLVLLLPVHWGLSNPEAAVYGVKLLEALLLSGSAALLFRLALRLTGGDRAAAWLSLAFLFVPEPTKGLPLCRGLLVGMESGINAFMILLLLNLLPWRREGRPDLSVRFHLLYGLTLALTFLARLDNVFLIGGIACWHGLQLRRSTDRSRLLRRLGLAAAVATLVAGAYLAWNVLEFGHPVPVSGRVKSWEASLAAAALLKTGRWAWLENSLWFLTRPNPTGFVVLGGLAAVPALYLARRLLGRAVSSSTGFTLNSPLPGLLLSTSLIKVLYYAFFQQYPANSLIWYYVQEFLLLVVALGVGTAWLVRALFAPRRTAWASAVLLLVAAWASVAILRTPVRAEWESASYDLLPTIRRHVPSGAIVGSWNAGLLGYFLPHPVVNLDGLANDTRFYEQLEAGTSGDYVMAEKIDYLIDRVEAGASDRIVRMMGPDHVRLLFQARESSPSADPGVHKIYEVRRCDGPR